MDGTGASGSGTGKGNPPSKKTPTAGIPRTAQTIVIVTLIWDNPEKKKITSEKLLGKYITKIIKDHKHRDKVEATKPHV